MYGVELWVKQGDRDYSNDMKTFAGVLYRLCRSASTWNHNALFLVPRLHSHLKRKGVDLKGLLSHSTIQALHRKRKEIPS